MRAEGREYRGERRTPAFARGASLDRRRGEWLYGRRPVLEALKAGKRHIHEAILPRVKRDTPEIAELRALLLAQGALTRHAERHELDNLSAQGNHQGVALRVGGFPYIAFDQVIHDVKNDPSALVLILDHIEDPQNVGSLLRTADAAGATAILLPEDRAAGVTPAAVRASAGASEHLRVARVVNLVRAMKELQTHDMWLTGLDMRAAAKPYTTIDFKGRVGLVVGAEGRGLSRLVGDTCDFIAHLPMRGGVASLNAGVAGAIALYEILRQRGQR